MLYERSSVSGLIPLLAVCDNKRHLTGLHMEALLLPKPIERVELLLFEDKLNSVEAMEPIERVFRG
jgi:hypothetical protein